MTGLIVSQAPCNAAYSLRKSLFRLEQPLSRHRQLTALQRVEVHPCAKLTCEIAVAAVAAAAVAASVAAAAAAAAAAAVAKTSAWRRHEKKKLRSLRKLGKRKNCKESMNIHNKIDEHR